jgi:hypothetical protein
MWLFEADSARFSFEIDTKAEQNDNEASSGGYMTFYDTPCKRTDYHYLSFDCRITETSPACISDVGVRLAVDGGQERELATYEIKSLVDYSKSKYNPEKNWKRFELYVPDLKQVWVNSVPTRGLDQNTINKVVFFIDNATARHCSKGTIWLKNVTLRP